MHACCLRAVHLVDMYILRRFNRGTLALQSYEEGSPKDMVHLHPNSQVAVLMK